MSKRIIVDKDSKGRPLVRRRKPDEMLSAQVLREHGQRPTNPSDQIKNIFDRLDTIESALAEILKWWETQ